MRTTYVKQNDNDKYVLVDCNGTLIVDREFEMLDKPIAGTDWTVFAENRHLGVINDKGEIIVPAIYNGMSPFRDCFLVVKDNVSFFINLKNEKMSPDYVFKKFVGNEWPCDARDVLLICILEDEYFGINAYGDVLLANGKNKMEFVEGGYIAAYGEKNCTIYDLKGNKVAKFKTPRGFGSIELCRMPYATFFSKPDSIGVLDINTGEVVINAKYEYVKILKGGDFYAMTKDDKYHFIDKLGRKLMGGAKFDKVYELNDDVIVMEANGKYFYTYTDNIKKETCVDYKGMLYTADGRIVLKQSEQNGEETSNDLVGLLAKMVGTGRENVSEKEIEDVFIKMSDSILNDTIIKAGCEDRVLYTDSENTISDSLNIVFEEGVKKIGEGWVWTDEKKDGASKFRTITLPSTIEEMAPNAFRDTIYTIRRILVPEECIEKYKAMMCEEVAKLVEPLKEEKDK